MERQLELSVLSYLMNLREKSDKYKSDENLDVAISCLIETFDAKGTKGSDDLVKIFNKGYSLVHDEKPVEESPESLKAQGNDAVKANDYERAISLYTRAIAAAASSPESATDEQRAIYYSNRSLCYNNMYRIHKKENYLQNAVCDGKEAVKLNESYHKGWQRLGQAYELLGMKGQAITSYEKASKLAPSNREYVETISRLKNEEVKKNFSPDSPNTADDLASKLPFLDDIKNDPEILNLMNSPKFMGIMEECKNNPMSIMKYMNDPDFAPIFQKIMGKMMGGAGNGGSNPLSGILNMMGGMNGGNANGSNPFADLLKGGQ